MKKRLLSLALCLALCLGLLPVGVLATDGESGGVYVPPSTSTGGGGVYVETHPVTVISGETEKGYDSIIEAFNNVDDGGTIRLNNDVTLEASPEVSGKNITLNLNGYVLGSNSSLTVKSGAALTVTNAGAENSEKPITAGLSLKLLVEKGSSFTCTDGGFQYLGLLSAGRGDYTLKLADGENHCTFGGFVQGDATATIGDLLKAKPGMALHADNNGSDVRIARDTPINSLSYFSFYVGACSEHKMGADGTCDYCGASYVASVRASGGEINNYTSLDDALDAMKDGDTVTLLSDAEITRWHSLSKAFTLELNDKTATTQSEAELYLHARVIVQDSSTGKTGGMAGTALLNVQEDGDLIIKSGTFNGRIAINVGKLTIEGGTFNQEVALPRGNSDSVFFSGGTFAKIWYPNSSGSFLDLLADGYAFYDKNGKLVNAAKITDTNLYNVRIRPHQHTFTGGACACGYTCPHTSVNESGACTVCHKQIAASVTAGEDVTYYDELGKAINYANQNKGCTLKLLANVESAVSVEAPLIFDLNGHNVQGLSVCAKATIRDSGTEKGKIGKVLIFDKEGETPNLTLGDLLEEGYGFKHENGIWADDSHKETISGLSVTVRKAPIQSVTVYAKDKNNKEVSTIAYGMTGEVTLVSSCRMGETSGADLTYLWYKLEGAAATAPLEGATGANYTLPDDLAAGTHTYLLICTSDGYSKSAEITITVTKIDLANATVTISDWPKGGQVEFVPSSSAASVFSPFLNTIKVAANGKEEYTLSDDDYTYDGATATHVGKYTLTITATDSCANYTGSKTFDWEVVPYALPEPSFEGKKTYTKTYDGTTTLPEEYKFQALFLAKELGSSEVDWREDKDNYEVTAAGFVSPDAGENKPINQTITLKNENFVFEPTEKIKVEGITTTDRTITYKNFTLSEAYPTLGTTFNIKKATVPDFDNEVKLDIINDLENTYTIDLPALPALESPRTYGDITYTVASQSLEHGYATLGQPTVKQVDGKYQLCLTVPAVKYDQETSIGTILVKVTTTNYNDVVLTVNLQAVNKRKLGMFVSVATDPVVYGMTLGDIKLSAKATDGSQVIPGTIAWEAPLTTVPAAGRATYRWTFTPDDTMHYLTASNTITFSVDKATPTGAPTYTAITAGGKTLADAALTANASWPSGTVQWVDKDGKPLPASTQVQANTEYTWSFTPADAANYNGATGSVTLYAVSSGGGGGGGGSSSASKTSTTTNADGSVTKTETKSDGTVVETTTGKDGSTTKTETKKDGSSVTENKAADGSTGTVKTDKNGQTTAETALSSKAIETAKRNGESVTAPIEVEATRNSDTAPTVKIELPRNSGETKVEIPVTNVKPGTVAVLVHPDGTEEIVKDSIPTERGVQLELSGSTTVKIIDNSKTFDDTKDHWSRDEVNFVAARELFNGVGGNQFGVSQPMTRGMVNTVLARLAGVDTTPSQGQTWYEVGTDWAKKNGISDGTDPTAPVTREQLATLLYRYAGSPSVSGTLHAADAASVSDYAEDALLWANQNGIVNGVGSNTIAPKDNAQRAQVAAMLARYLQNQ